MKFLRLYFIRGKTASGFRWEIPARFHTREHAQRELDMWRKTAKEGDEAEIKVETYRLHESEKIT